MKLLLLTLVLIGLRWPASAQSYGVTDLGDIFPVAINNAGQVIGGDILWENGKVTHLGRLVNSTRATALNNRGQIVGTSGSGMFSAMEERNVRAFVWQNGRMRDLGSQQTGSQYYATGINDMGQVIGTSYRHPLLWQNGHRTYLPKLIKDPPYTLFFCETAGINNRGQSVGYSQNSNGETRAVLWQNGHILDLGGVGGHDAKAVAINDQGQIVGYASTYLSQHRHAFLWQNGRSFDLKTLPGDTNSQAASINSTGEIVGTSGDVGKNQSPRAFSWHNGKMKDLSAFVLSAGWRLQYASGINDRGQIVGTGLHHGHKRAFLLTPKSENKPK